MNGFTIVNLTPHALNIHTPAGEVFTVAPQRPGVPRRHPDAPPPLDGPGLHPDQLW